MVEKQRSVFIRFNMEDEADNNLYRKLAEAAGASTSLTAYVKRALEEYLNVKSEMAERQIFHEQILTLVREEIQEQGMKLVGALLAGIGTVSVPVKQKETVERGTELPDTCEELPDELSSVLKLIS